MAIDHFTPGFHCPNYTQMTLAQSLTITKK